MAALLLGIALLGVALIAARTARATATSEHTASPRSLPRGAAQALAAEASESTMSSIDESAGVSTSMPPSVMCVPATSSVGATREATAAPMTFAVIGDFGVKNTNEAGVANLVATWNPAFIISVGDNYYSTSGGTGTDTYDRTVGAFYGAWLKDISTTGKRCPVGKAPINAFFPCLGNHDYAAIPAPETYLTYFTLPGKGFKNNSGNERYYDFVEGPIHFFVLNSNRSEPDGTSSTSKQAKWLHRQLSASKSPWNIVYEHHPPYSSDDMYRAAPYMRWPFAKWGADAVIAGHAHVYERIEHNGIPYFVNGLGGGTRYGFSTPIAGSQIRYCSDVGAQKVMATRTNLDFEFYTESGEMLDSFHLTKK